MLTKLERINRDLKLKGFSPKCLSVEKIIIIHDEEYEWSITRRLLFCAIIHTLTFLRNPPELLQQR